MALKVVFRLIDDLDGSTSDDVERIIFGLDGARYEIDLTEANASQFRQLLAQYIKVARCTGRAPLPLLTLLSLAPPADQVRATYPTSKSHGGTSRPWWRERRKPA